MSKKNNGHRYHIVLTKIYRTELTHQLYARNKADALMRAGYWVPLTWGLPVKLPADIKEVCDIKCDDVHECHVLNIDGRVLSESIVFASGEGGGSFTFVPELPDDCCPGDKDPGAGIYTVTSVYMGGWLQHFNVRAPGMDELARAAFLLAFGADYMYDDGRMAEGVEVSDGEELFPENVLDRWIHVVSGFVGEGHAVPHAFRICQGADISPQGL
jgi:hypothetical protein